MLALSSCLPFLLPEGVGIVVCLTPAVAFQSILIQTDLPETMSPGHYCSWTCVLWLTGDCLLQGIFKSGDPAKRARAIVEAVAHYNGELYSESGSGYVYLRFSLHL